MRIAGIIVLIFWGVIAFDAHAGRDAPMFKKETITVKSARSITQSNKIVSWLCCGVRKNGAHVCKTTKKPVKQFTGWYYKY